MKELFDVHFSTLKIMLYCPEPFVVATEFPFDVGFVGFVWKDGV